jgi:HK97 gp10 family phage protein
MRVNVKLQGLEKLLDNIQDYEINTQENVKQTVKDTALKIQANAKLRSPVDTGNLKRSISADISPDEMSATIFTDVEYAIHQEFGTKHAPAQPFLFPAYEEEMNEYMSNLEKALGGGKL